MSDRHRLQFLKRKYARYFDSNNNFVVPDRLNIKNLEDDDFLENRYALNAHITHQEDAEIEELLTIIKPREAKLIRMTIDRHYRILPKACKFSSRLILNEKTTFHFHGPSTDETVLEDYGLVVGNHKFAAFVDHPGFDYDHYDKYLRKTFYLDNKIPRCYVNGTRVKADTLTDTPRYYNEPDWDSSAKDLWSAFKLAKCGKPPDLFAHCSKISKYIEIGIPHCLSFGQFALIFPMLRNMKFANKSDEFRLLNPKKLDNFIYVGKLTCCFNCPLKYHVIIDFKHRAVFIMTVGKHLEGCHDYQKKKGFLVMKDLLNLSSDPVLCKDIAKFGFDPNLLKYYGFDDIDLYYKPSLNKCHLLELGSNLKSDMNQLVKLLDTKMQYYSQFKSPIPLYVNDEILTHSFTFNGSKSFIIGTKTGLQKMAEQFCFNVDFINDFMLKDLKLLTIPFKDFRSTSLVVGCFALTNTPITSAYLAEFIIALKELLNDVSESAFVNLKYIVTKDSPFFYDTFKKHFPTVKIVKNLMPRAEQLFTKLDKVGKTVMAEAMLAFDPHTAVAKIDALILYNRMQHDDLMLVHRDKQVELAVKTNISARQREQEVRENEKRFDKAEKLLVMVKYIEKLRNQYAFWCGAFKCVLPDDDFSGGFSELADEIKRKIVEATKLVHKSSELGVTQQEHLKKLFDEAYSQMINKQTDFDAITDPDVENVIEGFEKIYNEYGGMDIVRENGLKLFTDDLNSMLEFEFSGDQEMAESKPKDVIEVFYALQKYLIHKDKWNIKNRTLNLYKYPFVKNMTLLQELAFNRVMNLYNTKGTYYSVRHLKGINVPVTEDICGCFRRTFNCIPCEHMLYEVHTKCIDIVEQENQNLAKDSKEFQDAVQKRFDSVLNNKNYYERIVSRDPDLELGSILRARKAVKEKVLFEKRNQMEFYGVKIPLDLGEEFLDELNLIPIKHSGSGAVSVRDLPIDLSAAQRLAEITWKLQQASDKLEYDPTEGQYLGSEMPKELQSLMGF